MNKETCPTDQEWDKVVWEESWEKRSRQDRLNLALSEEGSALIEEKSNMTRRTRKRESKDDQETSNKRRKCEEQGLVWGEQVTPMHKAKTEFLLGPNNKVVVRVQPIPGMIPIPGTDTRQGGIIKFTSWELAAFFKYFARVIVNYGVSKPF